MIRSYDPCSPIMVTEVSRSFLVEVKPRGMGLHLTGARR